MRYAEYVGNDTTRRGDLSAYADAAQISDWARDAMAWAVGEGIITGRTSTTLEPQGSVTRAEAAVMLQRIDTERFKIIL